MKVGDSFAVPRGDERVRQAASHYARRKKMKFAILQNGDKSRRCWRIK